MATVAQGKERLRDWPRYADRRVIPGNADLAGRVVQIGALVFDLRDGTDHAESVRKARRDKDLFEIRRRQADTVPASKGRRPAPDVDGDVEDLAFDDSDELPLRPPKLQVQAAKRPP